MNQDLKLNVEKLQALLPKLKSGDAKFASDLIASFKKYGGLTPKQEPWIGKLIARASFEAFQVVPVKPFSQLAAEVEVGDFAGALKLFAEAKTHLKYPKIRLQIEGTKVILALNGEKSKKPGHVTVKGEGSYPNYTLYGSVSPEGVFTPANATYGAFKTALIKLLTDLAANPVRVAKDYGKLTGHCCFCGKGIGYGKEERSVLVGFGPDCAEHYGLKAEWLAAAEKAEAKVSLNAGTPDAFEQWTLKIDAAAAALKPTVQALPANIPTVADVPSFTVFASYPSQADTVLAAEAQHEAAYEAKLKDESFWSAVGTSIEALGEPAPAVPVDAYQAPGIEWKDTGGESVEPAEQPLSPHVQAAVDAAIAQSDAEVEAGWAQQVVDPKSALGPDYLLACPEVKAEEPGQHTCFFCEQSVDAVKILHGYQVCFTCVEQLKG